MCNRLEDSSNYILPVFYKQMLLKYEFYRGKGYQKSNAICIMAVMSRSTLWWPLYPFFTYCSTLYRLEVMPRCCNNLLYIYTYTFPQSGIHSKTNGSTNSGTSDQYCLPLRHYCMMLLLILLAFDAASSDCLAKQLTDLLIKPIK